MAAVVPNAPTRSAIPPRTGTPPKVTLSRWFLEAKEGAAARQMLEQAATEDPGHPEVLLTNASYALGEGRVTDAILSLEAAIWVSVVLMALNRIADRDRLRAQHDYELNVKAEEELKALMNHLMHQDEILLQIVNRLDRGDREMKRLARRLEEVIESRSQAAATQPPGTERPPVSVPAP